MLERTAIEVAENFPAGKAGEAQEQFHLGLVDPPDGGLGWMRGGDLARGIERLDLIQGMLKLLHAVEGPRARLLRGFGLVEQHQRGLEKLNGEGRHSRLASQPDT